MEVGIRKLEHGMEKLEGGSGNSEVGMRNGEELRHRAGEFGIWKVECGNIRSISYLIGLPGGLLRYRPSFLRRQESRKFGAE